MWSNPLVCRNGHERTLENTLINPKGQRECRECDRIRDRKCYATNPKRRQANKDAARRWEIRNPDKYRENQRRQAQRPEVKAKRKEFYHRTKHQSWRKFATLKSAAKIFKRDFTLTIEDYESIVASGKCSYCGGELPLCGYGVDRKDHEQGYTQENSVACCEKCNEKKGKLESLGFKFPRSVELLKESLGL
jgi:hypothetical protein